MKTRVSTQVECISTPEEAQAWLVAIEKTLVRDLEMVAAGERKQSDLHVISPKVARHSKVRWSKRATVDFRR